MSVSRHLTLRRHSLPISPQTGYSLEMSNSSFHFVVLLSLLPPPLLIPFLPSYPLLLLFFFFMSCGWALSFSASLFYLKIGALSYCFSAMLVCLLLNFSLWWLWTLILWKCPMGSLTSRKQNGNIATIILHLLHSCTVNSNHLLPHRKIIFPYYSSFIEK